MTPPSDYFDVAVIGMGPSGLTLAASLARRGRKVLIVEKHARFYGDPRAGHVDHEIARILQSLDAWAPVAEIAVPVEEYAWRNQRGELLIEFKTHGDAVSGYHSDYMQFQPVLENALVARIKDQPNVHFLQGWEAVSLAQDAEGVDLVLKASPGVSAPANEGDTLSFRAIYLVGADGANSFVRRTLGIERVDLGFKETWLDVDCRVKRPLKLQTFCGQICDPKRPRVSLPLGKHHHRWEWSLRPGETAEQMLRTETAWQLLADEGVGPEDVEILRHILYQFSALMATQWRAGRILLAGDAAHTQPPFMGQGMCSGVRDAVALAWRLDAILAGTCTDALLDSYQVERYPHTQDWTLISIASGEVSCVLDEQKAAERDALFRSGFVPPMPEFPYLKDGVVDRMSAARCPGLIGRLGLNARVEQQGRVALLEDLFYRHGWMVLSVAGRPETHLPTAQRATLDALGTTFLHIAEQAGDGVDAVDVQGKYRAFFAEHAAEVMIVRPDFYVFAAGPLADLPGMVNRLADLAALRQPLQTSVFAEGFTWPESPRWHDGALYLSDGYNLRIAKVVPGQAPVTVAQVPGRPSGLAFFPDGRLIVAGATDRKLWWVQPSGQIEMALDLSALATGQLNDMVVDAQGRVWVGDTGFVMETGEAPKPGRLFSWTPGSEPRIAAQDITFANGLVITPDGRTLYLNESFANQISAFDIAADGTLDRRRVHAKLANGPDGLCLDAEGALWVAVLFDRVFLRLAPDGTELARIALDKELAVACVFGGADRHTLYLAVAEHDFANPASVPVGRVLTARPAVAGAGLP